MIVVTVTADGIRIEGHADYEEKGKDIVCAAVSTLAQTLIKALESFTHDKSWHVLRPGYINIDYRNLSEAGKLLVDSFFLGICGIKEAYPEHLEIR